jgi:hypothetical protein
MVELIARIQRARDWAHLEAQKNYSLVEEHVDDGVLLQALAQQSRAAAFEAVRVVLEEILAPGHPQRRPPGVLTVNACLFSARAMPRHPGVRR